VLRFLRPATVILAFGLSIAAAQAGWSHFLEWDRIGENYKAYYAAKLTFAIVLLGAAAFAFWERKYPGLHLMAITGTALMLAGVQFVGLKTNSILCSTPT
jgi:peptidoglycan/LPS O-acetylase OafA/YrhL